MDHVIEGWLHPEGNSPPPCSVIRVTAIQPRFPTFRFALIEPAEQTESEIRHPSKTPAAAGTDPACACEFDIATRAERRKYRIDQPSRRSTTEVLKKHEPFSKRRG